MDLVAQINDVNPRICSFQIPGSQYNETLNLEFPLPLKPGRYRLLKGFEIIEVVYHIIGMTEYPYGVYIHPDGPEQIPKAHGPNAIIGMNLKPDSSGVETQRVAVHVLRSNTEKAFAAEQLWLVVE